MTEMEQREGMQKEEERLDCIKKSQSQSCSEDNSNQKVGDDNNLVPLTHKKRKKRHRKKVIKPSPQYQEELRVKKLNKKLEQRWDSHFINDQIPDILGKRTLKRHTLQKLSEFKRAVTALDKQKAQTKKGDFNPKKQTVALTQQALPRIQKNPKRARSFNIHVVSQKRQLKAGIVGSIPQAASKQDLQIREQYQIKVEQVFQQTKFLYCHKQLLEQFFQLLNKKSIRQMVNRQLINIKNNKSLINNAMTAISNRQKFLAKLKQALLEGINHQQPILQLVDHYRTSTLAAIEEILKWKQNWQAIYLQVFKKVKTLHLVYKTQNYLITIISSTDDILVKTTQGIPLNINNNQTSENNDRIQHPENNGRNQHPENVKQENRGQAQVENNAETQMLKKQVLDKLQSPKKAQEVYSAPQKPQVKQQILSNDPFLISLYTLEKQSNNIILKIRACQLLLLEEQFNNLKR